MMFSLVSSLALIIHLIIVRPQCCFSHHQLCNRNALESIFLLFRATESKRVSCERRRREKSIKFSFPFSRSAFLVVFFYPAINFFWYEHTWLWFTCLKIFITTQAYTHPFRYALLEIFRNTMRFPKKKILALSHTPKLLTKSADGKKVLHNSSHLILIKRNYNFKLTLE